MKTRYITLILALMAFVFVSCDEDEELPEFLDGTEFGILLIVDVTSGSEIVLANINTASVAFDISYDDSERSVTSIVVQKTYVAADGTSSDTVDQMTVTSPSSATLSISDLVSGISGLDIGDIAAGDSFSINFITNYADGFVVDKYGTGVNPNFSVTIIP